MNVSYEQVYAVVQAYATLGSLDESESKLVVLAVALAARRYERLVSGEDGAA